MSPGNDLKRFSKKSLSTKSRGYGFIQTLVSTPDGRGGEIKTWENDTPDPHSMEISSLNAVQVSEYQTINVEVTHLIKVRGEIQINTLQQIETINGRIFEVKTVEDIQDRGIVKWVMCKERQE